MLTKKVLDACEIARECIGIDTFPGNFFDVIEDIDQIQDKHIYLFKEDIDKLSGFIGYISNKDVAVCINYNMSIGRQNFTLAHEMGHFFMHKGYSTSDVKSLENERETREWDANSFAKELLYPRENIIKDYHIAIQNNLFEEKNRKKFGIYIDEIAHRYYVSYELALRSMLIENRSVSNYGKIKKEIEEAIGGKISEKFDKDFYIPNQNISYYRQYQKPYLLLDNKINNLLEKKQIGEATAEAIRMRYGLENI